MFETVLGLPLHALVVHAVTVLVPLTAVGVVAVAVVPAWRARFGGLLVLVGAAATASVPVATRSGTWLRDALGYPEDFRHGELGNVVIWLVVPMWLLLVALVVLDRRGAGRAVVTVVAVLAVVAAAAATAQVVRTGHTGSQSVWQGRLPSG